MAVKPANPIPIVKTGDVTMDKAEMETSFENNIPGKRTARMMIICRVN